MKQIDEAIEALEFYAETRKYLAPKTGGMGELYFDCGEKAKTALASLTAYRERLESEKIYYQHNKYKTFYRLIGFGLHESTQEPLVMYASCIMDKVWVRPEKEFHRKFTKVTDKEVLNTIKGDSDNAE